MPVDDPVMDPVDASASPEVQMNDAMVTLEWGAVYGVHPSTTTGLTWGYYGGMWGGFTVTTGTLTLTNASDNYIVVNRSTGAISVSTSATNWNDTDAYARVYKVTTAGGLVTAIEDHRAGPNGIHAGIPRERVPITWREVADDSPETDTLELGDAENGIAYQYSSDGFAVVPTNGAVAFPVGTSILLYQEGAGQLTVSPVSGSVTIRVNSTFTMKLRGQYSLATLVKRATNTWILSGDLEAA